MEEIITRRSDEFRELTSRLQTAISAVRSIRKQIRPALLGERYLTGSDICRRYHLSKRTLQEYRDSRIIPYTSIGGKILYPESGILKVIENNESKALTNI